MRLSFLGLSHKRKRLKEKYPGIVRGMRYKSEVRHDLVPVVADTHRRSGNFWLPLCQQYDCMGHGSCSFLPSATRTKSVTMVVALVILL